MKQIYNNLLAGLSIGLCSLLPTPVAAQIAADGSLSTVVRPNGQVFTITGGTIKGGNLFHSFSDFSVPQNFEAFFKNGLNIQNIISRVTGGNASNINGLIRANGTANLILINPNGINFGQGAELQIGGSFLATTANSIVFDDGKVFSVDDPKPMLTMNVPVGVQWGDMAAPIHIKNAYLQVEPGQSISIVGGKVVLNGGTLSAPGGRVEIGGIRETGEFDN